VNERRRAAQLATIMQHNEGWEHRVSDAHKYSGWYITQVRREAELRVKEWIDAKLAEVGALPIEDWLVPFLYSDVVRDNEAVKKIVTINTLFLKIHPESCDQLIGVTSIRERSAVGVMYGISPVMDYKVRKMMSSSGGSANRYKVGDEVVIKGAEDKLVYRIQDISADGSQVRLELQLFNNKQSCTKHISEIAYTEGV
jgi:hypothetical protein